MKSHDDKSATVLSPPIPSVARQTKAFLRARQINWPLLVGQAVWLAAALLILAVTMVEFKGWNRSAAIHGVAAADAPTAVSDGMWLASEIEKQRLVPYILAHDPDVVTALISGPGGQASLATVRAALNRKLEMLGDGTTAGVIYVLDASGKSVAASNWNTKQSFVGVDYAFRPYYKMVRQGGSAEYFASGLVSHKPGLFISYGVMASGKFVGVVVVKVQFETLEATWAQLGTEVMVTEHHGIVLITDVPDWRFQTLTNLPSAQRYELRATGQYGGSPLAPLPFTAIGGGPVRLDNAGYLPVQAAIPTTDWTLYLMVPVAAALAVANEMADGEALLLTALLIGAGLLVRGRIRNYFAISAHNEELRRQAVTDPLTELPNRRAFEASLERHWSSGWRARTSLAALMIDVDHFKAYNDFYGHQAGDDCLRMIAQVLRASATRQGDMAARYGGEEFVLLLPGADIAGARVMAEALRSGLWRLGVAHATSPTASIVTVSVGVAVGVPDAENGAAALISAADKALYRAKHAGRDRVVCAV